MSVPSPRSSTRALALSVVACCLVTSAHGAPSRIAAPESSDLDEEIAAYLLATPNERAAIVDRLTRERSSSEVLDAIEARHVSRPKRRRGGEAGALRRSGCNVAGAAPWRGTAAPLRRRAAARWRGAAFKGQH